MIDIVKVTKSAHETESDEKLETVVKDERKEVKKDDALSDRYCKSDKGHDDEVLYENCEPCIQRNILPRLERIQTIGNKKTRTELVNRMRDKIISAGADGGPRSRVCKCSRLTLRSDPHRHQRKFFGAHVLDWG